MIQRIQTIYLLLVLVLAIVSFFIPFYNFASGVSPEELSIDKYLYPILGIICVTAVAAIFTYAKRKTQKKVCLALLALEVLLAISGFVLVMRYLPEGTELNMRAFGLSAYAPVISIILVLLALRSINKDEALIRSMDRLR